MPENPPHAPGPSEADAGPSMSIEPMKSDDGTGVIEALSMPNNTTEEELIEPNKSRMASSYYLQLMLAGRDGMQVRAMDCWLSCTQC